MRSDFFLSVNDQDRWNPTDVEGQQSLIEDLANRASNVSYGDVKPITSGFVTNGAEQEITNLVSSGFSIPLLLTSAGYLLKHLSPILVEYMKHRSAKELTVDIRGTRVTIKGGVDFERDLERVVSHLERIGDSSDNA